MLLLLYNVMWGLSVARLMFKPVLPVWVLRESHASGDGVIAASAAAVPASLGYIDTADLRPPLLSYALWFGTLPTGVEVGSRSLVRITGRTSVRISRQRFVFILGHFFAMTCCSRSIAWRVTVYSDLCLRHWICLWTLAVRTMGEI